jgi:ABC-type transport system involved in multi-copper enzyme maturation permease subunit
MTTVQRPAYAPATGIGPLRVTLPRLVSAEWIKLRSVRSTPFSLLAAAVIWVGLAALFCYGEVMNWDQMSAAERARFDPTRTSLAGIFLTQLAIGVLGALALSGEYSTGMIRASMAAAPKRLPVLWSKSIAYATVTFVASLVTALVAFAVGQAILSEKDIQASLSDPGVLRAVFGAALYLSAVGLLGMALAALLRGTAGAISALFGLLLVVPILANFLPTDWAEHINKYLPSNAGTAIMSVRMDNDTLAPWTGFAVFCGYAVASLAAAAMLLRKRDV